LDKEEDTHLSDPFYFYDLIERETQQTTGEYSVVIDSNYLLQFNKYDLFHLFFDNTYRKRIANPLKKQMAMLIICKNQGKIALFVSNQIFRDFARIAPEKAELLQYYKKYFGIIRPKREYESFFIDLSTLLTLRANLYGFKADSSDTYSYIVACLANISFFITEDSDVRGIYHYLLRLRKSKKSDVRKEIYSIIRKSEVLFDTDRKKFPTEKILEKLFRSDFITLPISIKNISTELPEVTEKAVPVLYICQIINEILSNKIIMNENPRLADNAIELISNISGQMGIPLPKEDGLINIDSLAITLIEKEHVWKLPESFEREAHCLLVFFEHALTEAIDEEDDDRYDILHEKFPEIAPDIRVRLKCDCGKKFSTLIHYNGIVSEEERGMGYELSHLWNKSFSCPNCGKDLNVELTAWEYPLGLFNYANFSGENCKILNKSQIRSKIGLSSE
jgi:hypothetical protein